MKYRVVFSELSDDAGEKAEDPATSLDAELEPDVVLDARLVGRIGPDAQHSSDVLEEDDAFLGIGSEIWEYDVAAGKDSDFKEALQRSGVVMEFEPLESADELGVS